MIDKYRHFAYNQFVTSKQLIAWRGENAYSQGQLARVLGVDVMSVSRWERNIVKIPPFLHLALKWLEKEGGELKVKGTMIKKTKKERR